MIVKQQIEKEIREYLKGQFGRDDVIPNLMLEGIVDTAWKRRHTIYSLVQEEYDFEDIDLACEERGVTLSKREREDVYHAYADSDPVAAERANFLDEVINDVLYRREKANNG